MELLRKKEPDSQQKNTPDIHEKKIIFHPGLFAAHKKSSNNMCRKSPGQVEIVLANFMIRPKPHEQNKKPGKSQHKKEKKIQNSQESPRPWFSNQGKSNEQDQKKCKDNKWREQ